MKSYVYALKHSLFVSRCGLEHSAPSLHHTQTAKGRQRFLQLVVCGFGALDVVVLQLPVARAGRAEVTVAVLVPHSRVVDNRLVLRILSHDVKDVRA